MKTRFAINVTDAGPAINIGGQPVTKTHIYELPKEAIRLLQSLEKKQYTLAALSFVDDDPAFTAGEGGG